MGYGRRAAVAKNLWSFCLTPCRTSPSLLAKGCAAQWKETAFSVEQASAQIPVAVSVGVTSLTGNGESSAALLRRADQALYRAKGAGRNGVIAEAA